MFASLFGASSGKKQGEDPSDCSNALAIANQSSAYNQLILLFYFYPLFLIFSNFKDIDGSASDNFN